MNPFNDSSYFHDYCVIQQDDFLHNQYNVEHCRLAGLPDLNQDNPKTSQLLTDWISKLVKDYDFDGVRIDTIPEVDKNFWSKFSTAAGVFTIGEVFDGRIPYVSGYQGSIDATLNYPTYF